MPGRIPPFPAKGAPGKIQRMSLFCPAVGPSFTDGLTAFAADAAVRKEKHLRFPFLGFRIVAPAAGQRTAFEKNRGADSRPVVDTKPLDFRNNRLSFFSFHHPILAMICSCSPLSNSTNLALNPHTRTIRSLYFSGSSCAARSVFLSYMARLNTGTPACRALPSAVLGFLPDPPPSFQSPLVQSQLQRGRSVSFCHGKAGSGPDHCGRALRRSARRGTTVFPDWVPEFPAVRGGPCDIGKNMEINVIQPRTHRFFGGKPLHLPDKMLPDLRSQRIRPFIPVSEFRRMQKLLAQRFPSLKIRCQGLF